MTQVPGFSGENDRVSEDHGIHGKATNVWPLPMIGQSYTETSHTQVFDYTTEVKVGSTLPGN